MQKKCCHIILLLTVFLISAVPFIFGLVFSFIQLACKRFSDKNESVQSTGEKNDLFIIRLVISGLSAFAIVLPVIFLTDAVTTEGWLRSIYVSLLLATMAPFICAFSAGSGGSLFRWRIRSVISILFILPVPFGLILHHPWNYLAFFSPFYWINWAWIIPSPTESLIYGLISMALTVAGLLILYRRHTRYTTIS